MLDSVESAATKKDDFMNYSTRHSMELCDIQHLSGVVPRQFQSSNSVLNAVYILLAMCCTYNSFPQLCNKSRSRVNSEYTSNDPEFTFLPMTSPHLRDVKCDMRLELDASVT